MLPLSKMQSPWSLPDLRKEIFRASSIWSSNVESRPAKYCYPQILANSWPPCGNKTQGSNGQRRNTHHRLTGMFQISKPTPSLLAHRVSFPLLPSGRGTPQRGGWRDSQSAARSFVSAESGTSILCKACTACISTAGSGSC